MFLRGHFFCPPGNLGGCPGEFFGCGRDCFKPVLLLALFSKKQAALDDPAVLRSLPRKSIKVESLEEFARLLDQV
jgi:hypothetical protein